MCVSLCVYNCVCVCVCVCVVPPGPGPGGVLCPLAPAERVCEVGKEGVEVQV